MSRKKYIDESRSEEENSVEIYVQRWLWNVRILNNITNIININMINTNYNNSYLLRSYPVHCAQCLTGVSDFTPLTQQSYCYFLYFIADTTVASTGLNNLRPSSKSAASWELSPACVPRGPGSFHLAVQMFGDLGIKQHQ